MDTAIIVYLLIGLLELILIIAIAQTADNTKKMKKSLDEIKEQLNVIINQNASKPNSTPNAFNSYSQANNSSKGGSWNCKCGARVYNSDICKNCGAHRNTTAWMCKCGQTNIDADFCIQCGKPRNPQ